MKNILKLKTISEFHRTRQLTGPLHPLISVINYADVNILPELMGNSWVFDFYFISLKKNIGAMIKYGQQSYDFQEGVMFFIAPGQVFSIERDPNGSPEKSGWMLLIHPDFLWNTSLLKFIGQIDFFDYAINEALFVSVKEELIMQGIIENIIQECHANLDGYSTNIIVSHIETLLKYSERFYNRQFITRKKANHKLLEALEHLIIEYFNSADLITKGLPTVNQLAEDLNISPKYMSALLKTVTGQTAQQHIHTGLINKAKEKLANPDLSISEIAYQLGFEHPQSFSKLFKTKTNLSPLEFRQSFKIN